VTAVRILRSNEITFLVIIFYQLFIIFCCNNSILF
jgi:hypothetical protein